MEIVDPCEKTIVQNNRLIPATYPQESCSRRRAPYVLAPGDVCGGGERWAPASSFHPRGRVLPRPRGEPAATRCVRGGKPVRA